MNIFEYSFFFKKNIKRNGFLSFSSIIEYVFSSPKREPSSIMYHVWPLKMMSFSSPCLDRGVYVWPLAVRAGATSDVAQVTQLGKATVEADRRE